MHRTPLLNLLHQYREDFPKESDTCDQLTLFVEQNENCFSRDLLIGHVTGSAWIVSVDRTKTLLTHHRKLNRWLQPGGHADGNPNIHDVALREAKEESGLSDLVLARESLFDIDIHMIPARGDEPQHNHYDCRFLIEATGSEEYQVSDESHDLAWVNLSNINAYTTEESVLRMVRKTR